jgi:hypothetical protein
MTTKKLMLATAIALCLTAPAFAQDNNTDGAGQQANNSGGQTTYDNPLPDGFQPNGYSDNAHWTSRWTETKMSDGSCVWNVRVDKFVTTTLEDGRTVENENVDYYSVRVPCDQPHPYVTGVDEPPVQYVTPGPVLSGDPDGVELTADEADAMLRQLFGQPDAESENDARELDKALHGEDEDDQLNGKGKFDSSKENPKSQQQEAPKQPNSKSAQTEPQAPAKTEAKAEAKTDAKVDSKTATETKTEPKTEPKTETKAETKTETNPEHSMRSVTPEKVEPAKEVARTAPVEHTTEPRNVEAHQTISHVTSNIAPSHMNSIGNVGAMHTSGMGGFGGMQHIGGGMGGLGGMQHIGGLGGLGGMHMSGMGGMGGGMGGMHFGRR